MKYAIFSDIHGNLEALQTVLKELEKEKADIHLCVGDIVGYGANPTECIREVQALNPVIVCGNHDWAACGMVSSEYFNTYAKNAILWTERQLGEDDKTYLKSLPLTYEDKLVTMVHGTLDFPEEFSYMFDGYAAAKTMELMKTPICFIGHSHIAGTFYERKKIVRYSSGSVIELKPRDTHIVNVGSIGQPRDGDPRASYCVYDSTKGIVEIKRVPYDVVHVQQKILNAGLPSMLASRLGEGK
jgi:predicted phosphodiesterase